MNITSTTCSLRQTESYNYMYESINRLRLDSELTVVVNLSYLLYIQIHTFYFNKEAKSKKQTIDLILSGLLQTYHQICKSLHIPVFLCAMF